MRQRIEPTVPQMVRALHRCKDGGSCQILTLYRIDVNGKGCPGCGITNHLPHSARLIELLWLPQPTCLVAPLMFEDLRGIAVQRRDEQPSTWSLAVLRTIDVGDLGRLMLCRGNHEVRQTVSTPNFVTSTAVSAMLDPSRYASHMVPCVAGPSPPAATCVVRCHARRDSFEDLVGQEHPRRSHVARLKLLGQARSRCLGCRSRAMLGVTRSGIGLMPRYPALPEPYCILLLVCICLCNLSPTLTKRGLHAYSACS